MQKLEHRIEMLEGNILDMKNAWKIKELQIRIKAEKEIEDRFIQKQIRANLTFK